MKQSGWSAKTRVALAWAFVMGAFAIGREASRSRFGYDHGAIADFLLIAVGVAIGVVVMFRLLPTMLDAAIDAENVSGLDASVADLGIINQIVLFMLPTVIAVAAYAIGKHLIGGVKK